MLDRWRPRRWTGEGLDAGPVGPSMVDRREPERRTRGGRDAGPVGA